MPHPYRSYLLISSAVSQHWHTMFDEGKWAVVPEEPVGKEILHRLIEAKDEAQVEGSLEERQVHGHILQRCAQR